MEDLYICTDEMRDNLIVWITQAQGFAGLAASLAESREYYAAACLMQERDKLITRIMYVQEWADTHTEYPGDSTFVIPKDVPTDQLSIYKWWYKYGSLDAVHLAEVIW